MTTTDRVLGADQVVAELQAGAASSTLQPERAGGVMTHRQILVVFSGLMLGMLLAALDQSIVSTALPTIVGDFHSLNRLTWVVTAYLLTSTVSAPLYGKISDLYGRKRIFQFAISHLPRRIGPGRSQPEHGPADRLPRRSGTRGGRPDRARDGDRRRRRLACRTWPLPGILRGRVRYREHRGTARREAFSSTTPLGAGSST